MDNSTEVNEGFSDSYSETLREQLDDFDNEHLKKLMILYYDRWNWETGYKHDYSFVRLIEEILDERQVYTPMRFGNNANDIKFTVNPDTKIDIHTNPGQFYEMLSTYGGTLQLGFDLKKLVLEQINQEINFNSSIHVNGFSLRDYIVSLDDITSKNVEDINSLKEQVRELQRRLDQKDGEIHG